MMNKLNEVFLRNVGNSTLIVSFAQTETSEEAIFDLAAGEGCLFNIHDVEMNIQAEEGNDVQQELYVKNNGPQPLILGSDENEAFCKLAPGQDGSFSIKGAEIMSIDVED